MVERALSCQFARLGRELLANLLQHVQLTERMGTCALVCLEWHAAAAMTVAHINLTHCSDTQSDSLSAWLLNNEALPALTSIRLHGVWTTEWGSWPVLTLPTQQLQGLQELQLSNMYCVEPAAPGGDAQLDDSQQQAAITAAVPQQGPSNPLPALTRLELHQHAVDFPWLPLLANLQHLKVSNLPAGLPSTILYGAISVLARALPTLTHLTFLHLETSACDDKAVAALSCLQRLRSLTAKGLCVSSSSFAALPVSLTALNLHVSCNIGPRSTPRIGQLTDLQQLQVESSSIFDASLLWALTGLTHLAVNAALARHAAGQPHKLLVLSQLTQLQHLALQQPRGAGQYTLTDSEASALTTSSQISNLSLQSNVCIRDYKSAFPPRHHQLQLAQLQLSVRILADPAAVQHMVACCQELQDLRLYAEATNLPAEATDRSLACLSRLTRLSRLPVLEHDMCLTPAGLRSLADITALQHLTLGVGVDKIEWMLELTKCRRLESLCATVLPPGQATVFSLSCQASPGGSPDVWARLPAEVLRVAGQQVASLSSAHPAAAISILATSSVACTNNLGGWTELPNMATIAHLQQALAKTKSVLEAKSKLRVTMALKAAVARAMKSVTVYHNIVGEMLANMGPRAGD